MPPTGHDPRPRDAEPVPQPTSRKCDTAPVSRPPRPPPASRPRVTTPASRPRVTTPRHDPRVTTSAEELSRRTRRVLGARAAGVKGRGCGCGVRLGGRSGDGRAELLWGREGLPEPTMRTGPLTTCTARAAQRREAQGDPMPPARRHGTRRHRGGMLLRSAWLSAPSNLTVQKVEIMAGTLFGAAVARDCRHILQMGACTSGRCRRLAGVLRQR